MRRPIQLIACAAAVLIGSALELIAFRHRDGFLYPLRARLGELTPDRALAIALIGIVVMCALHARARLRSDLPSATWAAAATNRIPRIRVAPVITLPVIVAFSAAVWTVLSAETTIPRILGDELIYSGIAKSIALNGSYLLRGERDIGHSQLYPPIISPAYALARNGVSAHAAVQAVNAVMFSLAAVPTYFLARRVVPSGMATLVAVLAVANPWGGFTAWVMTESAFYPVFTAFALALVLALERPTALRQLTVVGLIVVLATIRAEAAVIPAAAIAAVLVFGVSKRAVRKTAREQRLLLGLLTALLAAGALVLLVTSLSAYSALFDKSFPPMSFVRWGAWNVAAVSISAGVAAAVTLPAALAELLRRAARPGERATGAATITLATALLAAVALLSASGYGVGQLQERSVFYVAPLVYTCFAFWLHRGARAHRWVTAMISVGVLALAAWLPSTLPRTGWTAQAAIEHTPDYFGAPAPIVALLVGALIVLLSRSGLAPIMLTVVALATITAVDQTNWNSPVSPSQSKALAWIDAALPPGADATIVNVDIRSPSGNACAAAAKSDQQFFVVLSEFLNTHVNQTTYLYHPVERDYLAARQLELGPKLTLLDRGQPLAADFVVIDSRVPVNGRPITRLDLATIGSDYSHGASLTLWQAAQPVRLDLHGPVRLSDRPDGQPCA